MGEHLAAVSRRDLLKKSAVAGAIVWTAPVLMSSPAFAATGKCSGSKPCVNFYYVKYNGSTEDCVSTADGSGCPGLTLNDLKCPGTNPPPLQNGCQFTTGSSTDGSGTISFAAGIVPLVIQVKPGDNCYTVTYDAATNTFTPSGAPAECNLTIVASGTVATGITVTIGYNDGGSVCKGISHIGAYFCK